ncbi:MAG: 50S ribosomal protein L13 [Candidatus Bathyarchaeota archaeon]|nr:50S ribosomal protein L13 [Candidatus Bathyarchaeota archaeon]MDH5595658.1 50S ribosomal protein L13 [Candidatus Bathyarchaeota archaeon]
MGKPTTTERVAVIDATGLILGRMASHIAKRLLQGEKIIVVNAENAAISGKRLRIVKEAKRYLEIGHPRKGPLHRRRPDRIVRRTIRGMLPRKKPKGKQAYKRLKVFLEVPEEFKGKEIQTIPNANAEKLRCPYITVGKLAKEIGWTPIGE